MIAPAQSPPFILQFPIFKVLLFFCIGITLGIAYHPWAYRPLLACILLLLATLIGLTLFSGQYFSLLRGWFLPPLLVYPLFILLGLYDCIQHDPRADSMYFAGRKASTLFVKVDEPPSVHSSSVRFRAKILSLCNASHIHEVAHGNLLVGIKDSTFQAEVGDVLSIPAKYEELPRPSIEAGFDYKTYEAMHGVFQQSFLLDGEVFCLRKAKGFQLRTIASHFQMTCAKTLSRHISSAEALSFISAMTVGVRTSLPQDLYTSFARTGTVHIISISGMHVYIVYSLVSWILSFLKGRGRFLALVRKLILLGFIFFYALVSGLSPAVCRCAFVIALVILSEDLPYPVHSSILLCGSAFILLVADPWILADIGFQLSYMAVTGLHIFQGKFAQLIRFENLLLKKAWSLCTASLAAQVMTIPLCLFYFHQFPVYFLPANLLIIPLTGLILYLGISLLIASFIPILSDTIAWLYSLSYACMNHLLHFFSSLPGAVLDGTYPSAITVAVFYYVIFALYFWLVRASHRNMIYFLCGITLLLAINLTLYIGHTHQRMLFILSERRERLTCLIRGQDAFLLAYHASWSKKWYLKSVRPELCRLGVHQAYLLSR